MDYLLPSTHLPLPEEALKRRLEGRTIVIASEGEAIHVWAISSENKYGLPRRYTLLAVTVG